MAYAMQCRVNANVLICLKEIIAILRNARIIAMAMAFVITGYVFVISTILIAHALLKSVQIIVVGKDIALMVCVRAALVLKVLIVLLGLSLKIIFNALFNALINVYYNVVLIPYNAIIIVQIPVLLNANHFSNN
jgi:hypothetical protein